MRVDEGCERPTHRLYCLYGLDARAVPAPGEGRFFGDVFDLDRYHGHYAAARENTPAVLAELPFAAGSLDAPEVDAGDFAAGRLLLLACPASGYVLLLEVETDVPVEQLAALTASTCFSRGSLRLDGRPLLDALEQTTPLVALQQLQLGRDVHQLWMLSDEARDSLVRESKDGQEEFDMFELLGIVYRSRTAQRADRHSMRFPHELNRSVGTLACHARGVTVAAGHARHTEHALVLVAAQLLASLARLRTIRTATGDALRTLRDPRVQRASLDAQRRQFAELASTATNLEVDLSFGVEAQLDAVLVPEIVLEAYRDSLAAALSLPAGLEATSHMITRLSGALQSTEQNIAAAVKQRDEQRSARVSAAVGYISAVAIPVSLTFAYFAIPERVTPGVSILSLPHYAKLYAALVILLVLGSAVTYSVTVTRQRRRGAQARLRPARVRISAHRGGCGERPATIEAFVAASTSGADLVEFDVRRTRDGILVARHDPDLPSGAAISDVDYAVCQAELGTGCLSIAELLPLLRGKVVAHVDLKDAGYEDEVVRLCAQQLGVDGFVVTTLEDQSVRLIKDRYPEVQVALSLGRDMAGRGRRQLLQVRLSELFPERRLRACQADAVAVHHQLARLRVARVCRRLQLPMMVWTVNDEQRLRYFLCQQRADVVVTDVPLDALTIRAAVSRERWPAATGLVPCE